LAWKIELDYRARRELKSLDPGIQKKIISYLKERVIDNPRRFGKKLSGNKSCLWRYRVGDFRLICHLQDEKLTVMVVGVGHRKEIYD
jgi:mRNA interferase RelE/StbE